jgi:hypothetical protein
MFTRNIKDTFTANLLNAVSGVLGEAKKCKDCGCAKCTCDDAEDQPEETKEGYVSHAQRKAVWANRADDGKGHPDKKKMKKEGYMPTNDMPSEKDRKTAGKLSDLLKRERDAKEKKEPNGVKTEDTDMPWAEDPNNPTRKAGTRKDEYGNKIKNVAKHLAKKAMKANEEVEEIEEKRGLWDNIHAKRKRIKAGSGERMRKPGSEGAPSAADLKASQKEEVSLDDAFEQIDEAINFTALHAITKGHEGKTYTDTFNAHGSSIHNKIRAVRKEREENPNSKHARFLHTRMLGAYADWYRDKKAVKEESEQIDEISKPTLGRYINKAKDSIDMASYRQGHKEAHGSSSKALEKKLTKRHKGIETAVKKLTKEEQDFIDALNDEMLEGMDNDMPKGLEDRAPRGRARNAMGRAIAKKERNLARARKEIASRNEETGYLETDLKKRKKNNDQAVKDMKKMGSPMRNPHFGEEVESIDELSKNTMLRYVTAAKKSAAVSTPKTFAKRMRGTDLAVRKYTARDNKHVRVPATEETEITEARGRPKKAGARDFTIHPKTKEKLMHNNPEHMKRIERLQKTGILQKPKTEANQHVIQQLQRAKLSMRGGETVNFTHGDPTHVSGTHASKLLDKYAGMKPNEKEAFQKKIGHSHENLKSEL